MKIIAGPCVLDGIGDALDIAAHCKSVCDEFGLEYYFKASWDKANRTSVDSYRGPGLNLGIDQLWKVKDGVGVKILTDVHLPHQAGIVEHVADVIQIPAFLCRQTDMLTKAALTGRVVNIKKGQFCDAQAIGYAIGKCRSANPQCEVWVTERGNSFGYGNLVVDFRNIPLLRSHGCGTVIFDCTHSVQLPGLLGTCSGGDRKFAPVLAKAAVAVGADGIFAEVHPAPERAKCDGANSLKLKDFKPFIEELVEIHHAVQGKRKAQAA